jgi:hypothetical protein
MLSSSTAVLQAPVQTLLPAKPENACHFHLGVKQVFKK